VWRELHAERVDPVLAVEQRRIAAELVDQLAQRRQLVSAEAPGIGDPEGEAGQVVAR
jgi:hypothetical protein